MLSESQPDIHDHLCRGLKTLTVEAKDRVPRVLPFAAMPGFKPLVVFTAVLVLPSAPS